MFVVSSNFMVTSNGVNDFENPPGQRIGDKITLSGVSFKMMLELNERYSDVTFRLMVVRSAKGDTSNDGSFWQGASGNKMPDTVNTERFTILHSKYVKMKAPFFGFQPTGLQQVGSGFATCNPTQSRVICQDLDQIHIDLLRAFLANLHRFLTRPLSSSFKGLSVFLLLIELTKTYSIKTASVYLCCTLEKELYDVSEAASESKI